jgi:uncharacterized membrane protein YhaH (DUF805 family)
MKKDKWIFWITTGIIVIFDGVMPLLTFQSEMAKEGIRHLGYPDYFGVMLTVFKVLGAIALIIPVIPKRVKEWAYAGFAIDFISAFVSISVVEGIHGSTFFPIVFMVLLVLSYVYWNRISKLSGDVL